MTKRFRKGQRVGKYRIEGVLGSGGFATVYRATDTVEGVRVALKVADPEVTGTALDELLAEVRVLARLNHPNILPLRNADIVDGRVVMAQPLGATTLADRMQRRLSHDAVLRIAEQLLDGLAYAHQARVIHCDIKPENVILFASDEVKLADFGIAKVAAQTRVVSASGRGTLGYVAPEQALGRPSFRSDVFSTGLLLYQLLTGTLPTWPFRWPPPNYAKLRRVAHPDLIRLLRKAMEVDDRKRFRSAVAMRDAFRKVRRRAVPRRPRRRVTATNWKEARVREFQRAFRKPLRTRAQCPKCHHPVAEAMTTCPWCAHAIRKYRGPLGYRAACPRCGRGVRADWRFCIYCFGKEVQEPTLRAPTANAVVGRCARCRTGLPPFARYCPACRAKVRRPHRTRGMSDRCPRCRSDVTREFWTACPWCGARLGRAR